MHDSTTIIIRDDSSLAFKRFRVRVVEGPEAGASATAEEQELSIGSAPGNDLVVEDPSVSRHHAVIEVRPDGCVLRDVGSRNGTFVGDLRIETAYLSSGASLTLGASKLIFEILAEEISEPLSKEEQFGRVLGKSPAMRKIFALLPRLAKADATLLLQGETGTGKSLLATAVHEAGPRAARPFVVVDCGAIPPTLIESELFGHEKGSFTGAHAARIGAFERANGGTLFLDEIGELPLDMQPKLLRALEDRVIQRVGGSQPIQLDVRLIAATNRDLRSEVNRGAFRGDLYYRLDVVRLRIPPLRERPEDIPLLVQHFFEQLGDDPDELPPVDLVRALIRQHWAGNVRELRAAVERTVLMGDPAMWAELRGEPSPEVALASEEPDTFDPTLSFRAAKERAVARWERRYLREILALNEGNLSRAARAARMDRNYLRELAHKHEIDLQALRDD